MASTTSAIPGHPRKRQKLTTTACEPCRSRKIRCDGNKPTCEACSRRSQQCIYQATPDISSANAYVDSLVNRVAQLEQELHNARATILKLSTSPSIPVEPQPREQIHHQPFSNIDPRLLPDDERAALEYGSVDAMGGDAGVTNPNGGQTFYGSSSAHGFTRQMYGSILPEPEPAKPEPNVSGDGNVIEHSSNLSAAAYMPPESFSLFPRELSDNLLSLYWSRVHVLYPFLHKSSFDQAYEDLWKPPNEHRSRTMPGLGLGASQESGPSSIVFHCALNAALALGMQFSDLPLNEKERLSSLCLSKSKDLLRLDLFDNGDIALVQTLLLLTQYFQSTNWPSKCWTSIGLACRLAQGLGLHVEEDRVKGAFDVAECEMRRRVWHGCVTMDIIVSMALGRPAMLIAATTRSLPSTLDGQAEILIAEEDSLSSIDFFTQTIKLYRIVGRILLNIYKINDEHHGPPAAENDKGQDLVRGFEEELTQYIRDIPRRLLWETPPGPHQERQTNEIAARQSHVLHVRVLHARVLLLRPVFLQYCREVRSDKSAILAHIREGSVDTEPLDFRCALSCVRAAVELISSVKTYTATDATGAWWYNVFYTRAAAMVVLLSGIISPIYNALGEEQWEESWISCTEILIERLPQYESVKACLAALTALRQNVLLQRSGRAPTGRLQRQAAETNIVNGKHAHADGGTSTADLVPDLDQLLLDSTFDPFVFLESELFADSNFNFAESST